MADNTKNAQNLNEKGGELYNIGNHLALRYDIDPDYRVTKIIRSNLSVVDIIPVDYSLKWQSVIDKNEFAISYDYDSPIKDYKRRCLDYGLEAVDGLRLWLTDDTQAYEEITNTFDANIIENTVNKLGNWGQNIQGFLKSFNLGQSFGSAELSEVVKNTVGDLVGGKAIPGINNVNENIDLGSAVGNVAGTIAGMVAQGKQASLPKIWRQSDYNPSVTFNVKLISPYGSPKAIKHFIIAQLVYILLLSSPSSTDGLTYGLYQPVKIKGYGMTNINLGAITSVSLRRGGKETAYNVYKQPLQLEVAITCMPLSPGFAFMTGDMQDVATMDHADVEYEENAYGSPAFTTVGNIIQSLRPAPIEVTSPFVGDLTSGVHGVSGTKAHELGLVSLPKRDNIAANSSTLSQSMQTT